MSNIKGQSGILSKLGIQKLNAMQKEAGLAINSSDEIMLLSPTGTGKTLAFLLPIITKLNTECKEVQVLIVVPSRELAIQIEQVARNMGTGYKTNTVYGGQAFSKDLINLKHRPAILIGTPGRIADHIYRQTFITNDIKILVLDEFDKSLEIGFELDMKEILEALTSVESKILTSATQGVELPKFVSIKKPTVVDYLAEGVSKLEVKTINSPTKDKLKTLVDTLYVLGNKPGIIFCNFKDSIDRVSEYLTDSHIGHGCFYGGMEQNDRERALIKFRNGTHQLLIATDLAARGIDVPEIEFIIHYHLPLKADEFTHRNGRTARMNSDGTAYVLKWEKEQLPEFITNTDLFKLTQAPKPALSSWSTLFISGGRKDKISKGDIAGLFFKKGNIDKDDLGVIELKTDCAFVGIKKDKLASIIDQFNNTRIKKRKVRMYEV
tara:strand:+ start:3340 stop:4647 length:1308 start_codon:yes stop_codon:yes gene_type:complete